MLEIFELLQEAGVSVHRSETSTRRAEVVPDLEVLRNRLEEEPELRAVMIHQRPEISIATTISRGVNPIAALRDWERATSRLLSVFRQYRRRMLLLDRDLALDEPASAISMLNERLTLGLMVPDQHACSATLPTSPLQLAVAALVVRASGPQLQEVLEELEASSVEVSGRSTATFAHQDVVAAQEELVDLHERIQATESENSMLIDRHFDLQEELERQLDERERSASQMLQRRLQERDEEASELERLLTLRTQQLGAIRHSISWRLTTPLRRTSKVFRFHRRKTTT
jgi:hypothetical protein